METRSPMDFHGPQGVHGVPRAPWGPQAPWSRMGPIDPMGPMGLTHGTYGPHRPHGPHGGDPWYLKTIPEGALDEDDYNFLHGYPTASPIKFWYHRRDENNGQHDATPCHYSAYFIQEHWMSGLFHIKRAMNASTVGRSGREERAFSACTLTLSEHGRD